MPPDCFRKLFFVAMCCCCALPAWGAQGSTAPEERFDVWEYRVLGNSVLAAADIESAVYPHLGPGKTLTDVEAVRMGLEVLYRDQGYGAVFVDIPEQDVGQGVVRLKVTEGRVDRVRIEGARYFSNGRIRDAVPSLATGKVIDLPELQDQLGQVNRSSADRRVTPVLRAGREPGTVDVDLKVQDTLPLHASVEINDRYTADTTRTRASLTVGYDNLFQQFHRFSIQYQDSPEEPGQSRVLAGTYIAPWFDTDDLVAVYAVDTDSDFATLGAIGDLSVLGTGRIYGVRYIAVLQELPGYSHTWTFGADFKDFEDAIVQPDGLPDRTPVSYLHWSSVYSGNWRRADGVATGFGVGANFGMRGVANDPDEFEFKRFKAPANYFYLNVDLQHERPSFAGSRLFFKASGQYAVEPLISNEQFAIGGADTVRGYLESEELGDIGATGTLELRLPQLTRWFPDQLQQLYAFGFYDAGVVGILKPLLVDNRKVSRLDLSSWGLGFRMAGFGGLQASLDWATPLQSTDRVDQGDSRVHFQVRFGF